MKRFTPPPKTQNPFVALPPIDGSSLDPSELVEVDVKNAEGDLGVIYVILGYLVGDRIEYQVVSMNHQAAHQLAHALRSAVRAHMEYQRPPSDDDDLF